MMLKKYVSLLLILVSLNVAAQTPNSVGIGTTNPNNSAILHLESSNQGFLMPRLTTAQISAISAPTVGLVLYNTQDQCFWYKKPNYWGRLCNTDSLGNIFINSVTTNSITSTAGTFTTINTNTLVANTGTIINLTTNTLTTSYFNFGNGYGDSIFVHYAAIDTAVIHTATINNLYGDTIRMNFASFDSLVVNGQPITTLISNMIDSTAWLLKGNSGTNPLVNFIGTKDNKDLVIRTNNLEKMRVKDNGSVGVGTSNPDASALFELNSTTKGFLMPKLTTAQINSIVTPTTGLMVFNTQDQCYWYKHTIGWKRICNTDSLGNIYTSSLTTNTLVANTGTIINLTTNTLVANTASITNLNFNTALGDSIIVNYAQTNTLVATTGTIISLTTNTLNSQVVNTNSLNIGGNSIQNIITDSITKQAWLLKGNLGTNPSTNYLGTKDNQDLVFRTNDIEKVRIKDNGAVGFGTSAPHSSAAVEINNTTKGFLMPKLTTAQINAIVTPTTGLMVFNTQDECYWYKHSNGWKRICNTDSLGNIYTSSLTTSTLVANTATIINLTTNTLVANTASITNLNFNTALGDSIIVNYAQTNTLVATTGTIINLTTNTLVANTGTIISLTTNTLNSQVVNTNSLNIGGNSIQNIITDSITKQAWLLKGNLGTNPAVNFLGTKDNKDLVFRTNNTEKVRITPTGSVGIGTTAPTEMLDVTQKIRLRLGASDGFILQSNATGVGTWTSVASLVSVLSPTALNNQAWTLLGNSATNPTVNFVGTTDNKDLSFRTNNQLNMTLNTTGKLFNNSSNFSGTLDLPNYSSLQKPFNGLVISNDDYVGLKRFNNYILLSDPSSNTAFYNLPSAGFSSLTNAKSNYVFETSSINSGDYNFVIHPNDLSSSSGNFVYNPYLFIARNKLTGSDNNYVIGHGNELTNAQWAYVFGGSCRVTGGNFSLIAGPSHTVSANGTFVYGESNNVSGMASATMGNFLTNTIGFSFLSRYAGGYTMYSGFGVASGVTLATGGGAWASVSDRNLKENITEVSNKSILEKLISVPVTEWTYLSQKADSMNKYAAKGVHYDKAPVHIGPMAQDFAKTFGYGEYQDKITTSDIDGVMFAGVQALAQENKELKAKIEKLESVAKEIEELKKIVNEIKNR